MVDNNKSKNSPISQYNATQFWNHKLMPVCIHRQTVPKWTHKSHELVPLKSYFWTIGPVYTGGLEAGLEEGLLEAGDEAEEEEEDGEVDMTDLSDEVGLKVQDI